MYKKLPVLFFLITLSYTIQAQDTFSIVAVDPVTGEIGSAGASCLDENLFPGSNGAIIISDIIPGRGAIHTQASYTATNQNRAHARMVAGDSPDEIIAYMKANDVNLFTPTTRQYGVVDMDAQGNPRSAGYTGVDCFDYKNHVLGANYAIQGNILLGQSVLDSMEANFLNTQGTLADKLMAALQGANIPGADTRCLSNGTSSLSAFLRVAKPDDDANNLYLDLNVPSLPAGQEPIDSVQTLYDQWLLTDAKTPIEVNKISIFPNPASDFVQIELENGTATADFFSLQGKKVFSVALEAGRNRLEPVLPVGVYVVRVFAEKTGAVWTEKVVFE